MTSPARVARPSPEADRVRPAWLAASIAGGLVVGLGLISATLSPAPSTGPSGQDPSQTPAVPADAQEDAPEAEAEAPGAPATAVDGGVEPETPSADDTEEAPVDPPQAAVAERPDPRPAPPAGGRLRMVPGRVAYLQCEGVPLQEGPFPCPRDLALENRVWEALRALPDCPTAPEAPGRADVRLHFGAATAPELHFLGSATDLKQGRLRSCLEAPLTALNTTLAPERMVVSFRFELVPPR